MPSAFFPLASVLHSLNFPSVSLVTPSHFLFLVFSLHPDFLPLECSWTPSLVLPLLYINTVTWVCMCKSCLLALNHLSTETSQDFGSVHFSTSTLLLTYIVYCLLNVSTWLSNSHLELNTSQKNLWSTPHHPPPCAVFPISVDGNLTLLSLPLWLHFLIFSLSVVPAYQSCCSLNLPASFHASEGLCPSCSLPANTTQLIRCFLPVFTQMSHFQMRPSTTTLFIIVSQSSYLTLIFQYHLPCSAYSIIHLCVITIFTSVFHNENLNSIEQGLSVLLNGISQVSKTLRDML